MTFSPVPQRTEHLLCTHALHPKSSDLFAESISNYRWNSYTQYSITDFPNKSILGIAFF